MTTFAVHIENEGKQMQNLAQQLGRQLSHMWLGLSSVRSERGYRDCFEQPKTALRVEGWDD